MDNYSISNIEKFINQELGHEISDISSIIKSMIILKNNQEYKPIKRKRPYSVEDKIKLNKLDKNITRKIVKYHNEKFDLIGEAIDILSEYEYSITDDLFDFYEDSYIDVLDELKIECDDENTIKNNSTEIYKNMVNNVIEYLYDGKKTDIQSNKIKTYVEGITAYVFYKCIFLIPIENLD